MTPKSVNPFKIKFLHSANSILLAFESDTKMVRLDALIIGDPCFKLELPNEPNLTSCQIRLQIQ